MDWIRNTPLDGMHLLGPCIPFLLLYVLGPVCIARPKVMCSCASAFHLRFGHFNVHTQDIKERKKD